MGIPLQAHQERLPIIHEKIIIIVGIATKVSIHTDSETILKKYTPENANLQVAPQTTIKYIAFGASVENVLKAVILDNGNIENMQTKIYAVWKSPDQRRPDPVYIREINNSNSRPTVTIAASERQIYSNDDVRKTPDKVSGTLRYLL